MPFCPWSIFVEYDSLRQRVKMNIYHHGLISATQKLVSVESLYYKWLKLIFELHSALFNRFLVVESSHEGFPELAEKQPRQLFHIEAHL